MRKKSRIFTYRDVGCVDMKMCISQIFSRPVFSDQETFFDPYDVPRAEKVPRFQALLVLGMRMTVTALFSFSYSLSMEFYREGPTKSLIPNFYSRCITEFCD